MTIAIKAATRSSGDMLTWQYRTLLGELSQVTMHAIDDSCPCNQVDLDPPEYCLGKHLLNVSSLASETALMDEAHEDILLELSSEATKHHEKAKTIYCKGGVWPDLAQWSREWRKKIEVIYYACKVKLHQDTAELEAARPTEPKVSITGKCGTSIDTCRFTIRRRGKPHLITKEVETAKITTCKANTVKDLVKQSKELLTEKKCSLRQATARLNSCLAGEVSNIGSCRTEAAMGTIARPKCSLTSKEPQIRLKQDPTVKISGTCTTSGCSLKVKGAVETLAATDAPGLPKAIGSVIQSLEKRGRQSPALTIMEHKADMQDPLLATITSQICSTGACLMAPKGKLPTCTPKQAKKRESCIMSVKARNTEAGCKPEGTGSKKCPSAFAVCNQSVGCCLGGKK